MLSPQELFAVTVRDYTRTRRAMGLPDDPEAVRRDVYRDLCIVDNAAARGELVSGRPSRAQAASLAHKGDETQDPVNGQRTFDAAANKTVTRERGQVYTSSLLDHNPLLTDETWSRAIARLKRIMKEGLAALVDPTRQTNARVPKLAKEWYEVQSYFFTRSKIPPIVGVDHNPFRHLNDEDADRLLRRKVEDICDRSTGVFGAWRTPK